MRPNFEPCPDWMDVRPNIEERLGGRPVGAAPLLLTLRLNPHLVEPMLAGDLDAGLRVVRLMWSDHGWNVTVPRLREKAAEILSKRAALHLVDLIGTLDGPCER